MRTKHTTSHHRDNKPTDYTTWSHEALQARKRELKAQILRDFPMPATETDEDAYIDRLIQQHKHLFRSASPTAAAPADDAQPVHGNELLQEVTQFIARYLQCSEHQRTLLALWVLHTYCFCAARVTPYLAIRSADKQSGKTLCLQLLSLLCDHAALTSGGFTARDLALPTKEKTIAALLFDECQLTVGTRSHPRSPALRAVLAGSFHLGLGHRNIAEERNAFLPKAFASQAALPEELADRSIPIILEPLDTRVAQPGKPQQKNKSGPQPPSAASSDAPIERFDLHHVADQIKPLRDRLERWTKNNFNLLTNRTLLPRSAFPPNLSPRQQDLCDPLLQIAALVGGPWVARALEACAIVFELQSIFELRPNLQLLADVRDCFAHHNWPDRLPTEVLLDWTDSLPPRPWDADGALNPRTIAHLLRPFHIHSRELRTEGNKFRRGYELKDFKEPWEKYFPHSTIANKDAPCDTISHAHAGSLSTEARLAQGARPQEKTDGTVAAPGCVFETPTPENARKEESVGSGVAQARPALSAPASRGSEANQQTQRFSQKSKTPARRGSQIPNKNKGCDTTSLERTTEPTLSEAQKANIATQQPLATTKGSLIANCQRPRPAVGQLPTAQIAPAQQSRPDEILPGITCGDVLDERFERAFRR